MRIWVLVSIAAAGCHDDKPVITADPDFVKCENAKDKREDDCLDDAGTRAAFDECIARTRKTCVDGGK
jgi:hypothetical protein